MNVPHGPSTADKNFGLDWLPIVAATGIPQDFRWESCKVSLQE